MTYYMPQHLFNATVLGLALGQYVAETSPAEARAITDKAVSSYQDFYTEDDFLPEAEDCATRTLAWLRDTYGNDEQMMVAALAAFNDAVHKYNPDGNRKPWRLFNGLKFTSAREPVPDRSQKYFEDLARYFMHIQTGKIGG